MSNSFSLEWKNFLPNPKNLCTPFKNADVSDKITRMNYDIHVGAILGLPGKIFAFLISLLIASLPVTGFLIWFGRKFKSKN